MQNALFDDLKNLKTKMQENETKDNQKKKKALREQKEKTIKNKFDSYKKVKKNKRLILILKAL